jgi:hypothetical protein
MIWVKRWIWLYLILLLGEGALRKWMFPQLSAPLLIVRDPVLIVCYALALRSGRFPVNGFLAFLAVIAVAATSISLILLLLGNTLATPFVLIYGFRANFFHLPLVFLISSEFDRRDVLKFGRVLLWLAPVMAVIVYLQYRGGPLDWINAGAGQVDPETAGQISVAAAGVDKVRPAGVFSYNTGLASYLSLLAAFAVYGFYHLSAFNRRLLIISSALLVLMSVLAVSRSTLLSVAIVCSTGLVCGLAKPGLAGRTFKIAAGVVFAVLLIGSSAIFQEASSILGSRFEGAGGLKVGIWERWLGGITGPVSVALNAPITGLGLGLGTNAAAGLLTGRRAFLVAEGEWDRLVLEMGGLLGSMYIFWRVYLVARLGRESLASLAARSDPLPILILSASALGLAMGSFGQPTALGFAVVGGGLCLAAMRYNDRVEPAGGPRPNTPKVPLARGRSVMAARLHEP